MPQSYRGGPDFVSEFVLPDGRTAVHVPRVKTDYSGLHSGYPLAEEFLDHLSDADVDAIAIDDGDQIYLFDLYQYRWGSRIGHAPYPMKRVVSLGDATVTLNGSSSPSANGEPVELAEEGFESVFEGTDGTETVSGVVPTEPSDCDDSE